MANEFEYLYSQMGRIVGGGECGHLATEMLRKCNHSFRRREPADTQDYIWSKTLVVAASNGAIFAYRMPQMINQNPYRFHIFRVGDIIQYHNAAFADPATRPNIAHHTAIVARVEIDGTISHVFEQNVNNVRRVQFNAVPYLPRLIGGSIKVYRPTPRVNESGLIEYTILNMTGAKQDYTVRIGSSSFGGSLSPYNTANSYQEGYATFSGNAAPTLNVGGSSAPLRNGSLHIIGMMNGKLIVT